MIRKATLEDIHKVLPVAIEFGSSLGFDGDMCPRATSHFLAAMVNTGILLVAEDSDEIYGVLGATYMPSPWNPQRKFLEEQLYYVVPSHRNTTIGYRLIKKYHEFVEELNPFGATLKLMHNSPDLSRHYEKMGYFEMETTFLRMEN